MAEISELTTRLSKDFYVQLKRFIDTGKNVEFANVIEREELNEVNKTLEQYGVRIWYLILDGGSKVALTFEILPGTAGYFKLLCHRASLNFDKYLNRFLTDNQTTGLPVNRLSERMWTDLNIELLKRYGIILNRETYNGQEYMMFRRRQDVYNMGTQTIRQRLFNRIKQKYPNIPDININAMIEETDESKIYHLLRFKLDGPYDRPSRDEYAPVDKYFRDGRKRDDVQYFENHALYGFYSGPDRVHGRRGKYHISLNVSVNVAVLAKIEDIVRQDRSKIIQQYKFFDAYEDVVTRFDPITIYTYERDADLEQRIYNAIKPYVRSNEGLIGEEIGPGMVITPEITSSLGKSVGQKAAGDIAKMIVETPGLTH